MLTEEEVAKLTGKSFSVAKKVIVLADMTYRITSKDGEQYMGTCEFRPDRINLHIVNDLVTKASIG